MVTSDPHTDNSTLVVVIVFVIIMVVLLGIIVASICIATVVIRKRKATIRSLQLEVLKRLVQGGKIPVSCNIKLSIIPIMMLDTLESDLLLLILLWHNNYNNIIMVTGGSRNFRGGGHTLPS